MQEYEVVTGVNLYVTAACEELATQAIAQRHLRILEDGSGGSLAVRLCEDDYPGWIAQDDRAKVRPTDQTYHPIAISLTEIYRQIPQVLAFCQAALQVPHGYLWGGTLGPDYDCSGLVQRAFAAAGIWLPRDAYQQEAFVQSLGGAQMDLGTLTQGDLVFFGPPEKATHVGIYVGENAYIHCSGKEQGRNGIGIDVLSMEGDRVSCTYFRQFRGAGRVVRGYTPGDLTIPLRGTGH